MSDLLLIEVDRFPGGSRKLAAGAGTAVLCTAGGCWEAVLSDRHGAVAGVRRCCAGGFFFQGGTAFLGGWMSLFMFWWNAKYEDLGKS